MNLFVAGWSPDGVPVASAERALSALVARLPFFDRPVETWAAPSGRLALAWVAHAPDVTGGVRYVATEPARVALFTGRPFRWADEGADGVAPLDPRFYLDEAARWAGTLDGRYVALRYDDADADAALEVAPDALGAYPVYWAHVAGAVWISNNPELLRTIGGAREMSGAVLASVLGGGWSLGGDPLWAALRRLAPGGVHRFAAEGRRRVTAPPVAAAERFDPARAARTVGETVRALAAWPGRPSFVPVTGGRDSRLVLAAALAAGIDFETLTGGLPGAHDVEIGRRVAEAAGVAHRLIEDEPHGTMPRDWRRQAELLELTAAGTATLADAAGFPFGPRPGALPLWHSGQGGEVARAYYGLFGADSRDGVAARLYRAFVGRRPGRREVLSPAGARLVEEQIGAFVDAQLDAGTDPSDVGDRFYLERRMGTWAGPTHGCVEYVRDTTSPLWSRRLVADELALAPADRAAERFHTAVLEALAPRLLAIPYEDGELPGARRRATRARALVTKVVAAGRRRVGARVGGDAPDPFAAVLPEIRDVVLSKPEHPAWALLDRGRVEQLLGASAPTLDTMSRYYVWRLATVFSIDGV